MRSRTLWIATILSIDLLLAACAGNKANVLPKDGPKMKSIYEAHFAALGAQELAQARRVLGNRPVNEASFDLAGYTRTAYNEIEALFPRLPNPTLVLYVFPHLSGTERTPVPGYATSFPLYERVEYALPGEVPGRAR